MKHIPQTLVVDIWSDFVCPWCWIAKRRFEKALAAFEHRDAVQIRLRAYRIAPGHPAEPIKAALLKKFRDPLAAEGMLYSVQSHGAAEGLDYRFDTMLFGDTMDAHMLVKAAGDAASQQRLAEVLYAQSTSHGKSLFDRDSLALLAAQAGVPAEVVEQAWSTPQWRQQVQDDEYQASRIASGVPLFVFGNGTHISGAQPPEVFSQALENLHAQSRQDLAASAGEVCGLDGCILP
ncbi:DsbA family oxidoreductase [Janthinobacterium sp. NKUCC06_STL]|uniref:DsbA family oxidoreductase n=1 Tax=Janthinobacterium sp. NKUCC06_STL TaxID=2842127 RepID=UPI001C5BAA99|nr:DsbA family oxidoreductase [Janthinobacterium sp. NKUCC06_STL]MBW3512696.1 DsbA family oxidoreductase [Janthinobacterium sp. NKUCC06_STL]